MNPNVALELGYALHALGSEPLPDDDDHGWSGRHRQGKDRPFDAFEVNEAFASVVLAWMRATGADQDRVNRFGGAVALGHPVGASGGRLLGNLLAALEDTGGCYGLQTMCESGGMANATLIQRL